MRILLVEDDDAFASALGDGLTARGYCTSRVASAAAAIAELRSGQVTDLVLLDLGLPDSDGLALCAQIAREWAVPVIVVTARGDLSSRVQGLRSGADDYVVKPFALVELLARVEAVMRRAPAAQPAPAVVIGELSIDFAARMVSVAGRRVALTPKEFDLLIALIDRAGAVVTRSDLLSAVWGYQQDVSTRTVDIHVSELRAKLEPNPARPVHIITVRKTGYRFEG